MHPFVAVLIILLIPIGIIVGIVNKIRQNIEIANAHKQYAEWLRRREAEKLKKAEEIFARKKSLEIAISKATLEGKDVCNVCKNIAPKRCADCKLCISCFDNMSYKYHNLCKRCGYKKASLACDYAESQGKDVCRKCLTVEPKRCDSCRDCIICCGDGGGGVCDECMGD